MEFWGLIHSQIMSQCMSPFLAQSGRAGRRQSRQLLGVKRTSSAAENRWDNPKNTLWNSMERRSEVGLDKLLNVLD
jgi:hypothetical protein